MLLVEDEAVNVAVNDAVGDVVELTVLLALTVAVLSVEDETVNVAVYEVITSRCGRAHSAAGAYCGCATASGRG